MIHYDEFFKQQYETIIRRLDDITANLIYYKEFPDPIVDNSQFMQLMGISAKTAQSWRDQGIISYSQINSKIYYRVSDIKELLDKNRKKATKIIISHEK